MDTKMQWFKFYGQDWLTDLKIINMNPVDRIVYITLLCLASISDEPGVIRRCNEVPILQMCHLYDDPYNSDNDYQRAFKFLERFEALGMVTVTKSNVGELLDVTLTNFRKRQERTLTNAERQALYRERKKEESNEEVTEMLHEVTDSNESVTLDKNRVDKNRVDKNIDTKANKFAKPTIEEIKTYCEERNNGVNPDKFFDYYSSNGWKVGKNSMKDWRASVRTWEKNELSTTRQPRTFTAK